MGKIVISTNVSLDGVVQDPDGEEGFRLGGWFREHGGEDLEAWAPIILEEALAAEALLLGRRSDEWFATRWQSRPGEWADRLNGVVCATRSDVVAGLDVLLGSQARSILFEAPEPPHVIDAQSAREDTPGWLAELWADLSTVSRRRDRYCLEDSAFVLSGLVEGSPKGHSPCGLR